MLRIMNKITETPEWEIWVSRLFLSFDADTFSMKIDTGSRY